MFFGVGDEATVGMTVEIVEAGLVHRAKLARAERLAGRRARLHLTEVSYFDPIARVWHEPDEQGTTVDVSFVRAGFWR